MEHGVREEWRTEERKRIFFSRLIPLGSPFLGGSGSEPLKDLPAMQETQVQPLGREDPPKKGMTTHSSIPAWRIPWTEEPGGLLSMGLQRVGYD